MIPVAGIVAGLLAAGALGGGQSQPPDHGLRAVLAGLFLGLLLVVFGALALQGNPIGIALTLALLVLFQPWATCRLVLIPLGLPRPAYYVGRCSLWLWRGDTRGGGVVAASLAAVRRPRAAIWPWIEGKRNRGKELLGGGLLATAIAADARGEHDRARRTFEAVADLPPEDCCRTARALAYEWLVAEAVEVGEWERAASWGTSPVCPSTSAAAIGRKAAGTRWWWSFLWSFRWRALWPLVRWEPEEPVEPTTPVADEELRDLARSLSPDALAKWRDRALDLGAGADVVEALRDDVCREIAQRLRDGDRDVGALADDAEAPPLLREAAIHVRSEYLDDLEAAVDALAVRVDEAVSLPAADEWNEWQSIVRAYALTHERGGVYNRPAAFQIVHGPLCSLAVWLWNERDEYTVAHAIFGWLLAEAIAVDDEKAIKLQTDNVACRRGR